MRVTIGFSFTSDCMKSGASFSSQSYRVVDAKPITFRRLGIFIFCIVYITTCYQYAYEVSRANASENIARKRLKHLYKYLRKISLLSCISPSCDITVSSRRKIHGGQTHRSYVNVKVDRFLQFDQCHVIVVASRCRVIIRM